MASPGEGYLFFDAEAEEEDIEGSSDMILVLAVFSLESRYCWDLFSENKNVTYFGISFFGWLDRNTKTFSGGIL